MVRDDSSYKNMMERKLLLQSLSLKRLSLTILPILFVTIFALEPGDALTRALHHSQDCRCCRSSRPYTQVENTKIMSTNSSWR